MNFSALLYFICSKIGKMFVLLNFIDMFEYI